MGGNLTGTQNNMGLFKLVVASQSKGHHEFAS